MVYFHVLWAKASSSVVMWNSSWGSHACAPCWLHTTGCNGLHQVVENLSPPSLIVLRVGVNLTSHDRPAIYFQVAHSHSPYGKWLRWPFWPHTARIMVLLLKTLLTTITLKGGQGCLLRAGSMPAKSTKGCVCNDTTADNFVCLFTCGLEQQGAQMILDGNTVVLAISETKLEKPFLKIDAIVLSVLDSLSVWERLSVRDLCVFYLKPVCLKVKIYF